MTAKLGNQLAGMSDSDASSRVLASRGDEFPVVAEICGEDRIGVSGEDCDRPEFSGIPHPSRAFCARCDKSEPSGLNATLLMEPG